jgi:hypothetical protein
MVALALRGAGQQINVRPQTRLRQTVRDVIGRYSDATGLTILGLVEK